MTEINEDRYYEGTTYPRFHVDEIQIAAWDALFDGASTPDLEASANRTFAYVQQLQVERGILKDGDAQPLALARNQFAIDYAAGSYNRAEAKLLARSGNDPRPGWTCRTCSSPVTYRGANLCERCAVEWKA